MIKKFGWSLSIIKLNQNFITYSKNVSSAKRRERGKREGNKDR